MHPVTDPIHTWKGCKKILCIRTDNMGDLLMTSPALQALKASFGCTITLLTSSMAAGLVPFISCIDETLVFDAPWVKKNEEADKEHFNQIIDQVRARQFDAAIIFTVYSQNPLPAAMIPYLAGIPKRLAYCRENPYDLLTNWVPDREPYSFIQHQVLRDINLVRSIGARGIPGKLQLTIDDSKWPLLKSRLEETGIDFSRRWIILHPGVSEKKRQYPEDCWLETAAGLQDNGVDQLLITGTSSEQNFTERLQKAIGPAAFSLGGKLNLEEFILLIQHAPLLISVNTVSIHIAAATATPVIVLYALTNPQHAPWMGKGKLLFFDVDQSLRSRNEVIRHVHENLMEPVPAMVTPAEIVAEASAILSDPLAVADIQDMVPLRDTLAHQLL